MQTSAEESYRVGIIGGGITGLSAAWFLQQLVAETGAKISYSLLESSSRWGGKIKTDIVETEGDESFVVEAGPDSFLTQKPWALKLARALGTDQQLLGTNDEQRKVFVLNQRRLVPLPDGVMLIIPTRFAPFALSPLISPLGKLRMGMDLFIAPNMSDEDESLADFVRRRLGHEALDKLAEPLMAGIYNTEAENQSLLATFPRFRDLEKRHGSLTKGMLASRRNRQKTAPSNGKSPTMFTSFKGGMRELVSDLIANLTGDLRLNAAVDRIERDIDGKYLLALDDEQIKVDVVILAVPSYVAAQLLRHVDQDVAEELCDIRYVSTGTISLGWKREDIKHPLKGFGLVIPRSEKRQINAVTWTSSKFKHRAPDDHVLLRVFFGGSRNPSAMEWDDEKLLEVVRNELHDMMGIEQPPLFHRIYRWERANPQYDVGHLDRLDEIESKLPDGIYLAGSAYRGIGVPDCVKQAQDTVERIKASVLAAKELA